MASTLQLHLIDNILAQLRPAPGAVLGIDIGGTKIAAGVLTSTRDGLRLPSDLERCPTRIRSIVPQATQRSSPDQLIKQVVTICEQLLCCRREHASDHVEAIGVCVAELVDREQQIVSASTLPLAGIGFKQAIQNSLGVPVILEPDVRAAAFAEAKVGAGVGHNSFLYVTIGTGISASVVFGGEPWRGERGLTGTFASTKTLSLFGSTFNQFGDSLEDIASGPGLVERYRLHDSSFRGTSADLLAQASQGCPLSADVLITGGRVVGAAVAQLVSLLDPAVVILGGGLGLSSGVYSECLRSTLREQVWAPQHTSIPVLAAETGVDAGWIGAALFAAARTRC